MPDNIPTPTGPSGTTSATDQMAALRVVKTDKIAYTKQPSKFVTVDKFLAWASSFVLSSDAPQLTKGTLVAVIGEDALEDKKIPQIKIFDGTANPMVAWLSSKDLEPYSGAELVPAGNSPAEIDMTMATGAFGAARDVGGNACFLLCMAQIISGLEHKKVGDGANRRYGPFLYSENDWVAQISANPAWGLIPQDIGQASAQFIPAAAQVKKGVDQLSSTAGLGRLPSYAEVFLALGLADDAAAVQVLKSPPTSVFETALSNYFKSKSLAPAEIANRTKALFAANADTLGTVGGGKTLDAVLQAIGAKIDKAAERANALVDAYYKKFPSEDPLGGPHATRPWVQFALNRCLGDGGKAPKPEHVKLYVAACGLTGDTLPAGASLSAAFVAWTLKLVKEPKIKLPDKPHLAASWREWGKAVDATVPGAIVIVGGGAMEPIVGIVRPPEDHAAGSGAVPNPALKTEMLAFDRDGILKVMTFAQSALLAQRFPTELADGLSDVTGAPLIKLKAVGKKSMVEISDYVKRTYYLVNKSKLKNFVPKDGAKFGIVTGSAREWTILLSANTNAECAFNNNSTGDEEVKSFTSPSMGLGQMSIRDGDKSKGGWGIGLTDTKADILDPMKSTIAIVKAHEYFILQDKVIGEQVGKAWKGIARLNGTYRRPNETIQYLNKAKGWVDSFAPKS